MDFDTIPFQKIVRFGQRTMLNDAVFSVSWILGRFCNYKCSYCWPYANSQTPDYQDLEVYKRAVDEIRCQAAANGFTRFHWSFSGGEPTAYKHSIELMSKVLYDSIHMTTNLSPGTQWWDRWLQATSLSRRRSLTASFHHEFADEQEFGDKIVYLTSKGVFVTVNQVMVPEKFYELYERMDRLHTRGINVTLKPQSNESASAVVDGYTEDMIHKMRTGFPQHANGEDVYQIALYEADGTEHLLDQAERFNAFGFNKFQGWACNAGYQSVIIRSNEVKRAYSCHEAPLGTLENFNLFTEPTRCITPSCVSSADSKIPKCIN